MKKDWPTDGGENRQKDKYQEKMDKEKDRNEEKGTMKWTE